MKSKALSIPDWVPPTAAQLANRVYETMVKRKEDAGTLALVERLACDHRMEGVWAELAKHKRLDGRTTDRPLRNANFNDLFFGGIGEHLLTIPNAKAILDFFPYKFRISVAEMVPLLQEETPNAPEVVFEKDSPPVRRLSQNIAPARFFWNALQVALSGVETLSTKQAKARQDAINELIETLRRDAKRPAFIFIAREMMKVAAAYDQYRKATPPWLVVKRQRSKPRIRGFVIVLTRANRALFGSELYGTTAVVTNVAFQTTLNGVRVRELCRSYPGAKVDQFDD
ncbi:MAG TPA: hypothetical protein VNH44_18005 [Micropepsaceae bacterium]|nr:hypothetical protein [Micropepsaceae bacterium]